MLANVDWTSVTIGSAFALGIAVGIAMTVRVLKHLVAYFEKRGRDDS